MVQRHQIKSQLSNENGDPEKAEHHDKLAEHHKEMAEHHVEQVALITKNQIKNEEGKTVGDPKRPKIDLSKKKPKPGVQYFYSLVYILEYFIISKRVDISLFGLL